MSGGLEGASAGNGAVWQGELARQLLAAMVRTPVLRTMERLTALGADPDLAASMFVAGQLGTGMISLSRDGTRWEPEGPDRRLLIGVAERGELVDIVAASSTRRDEWALRTGLGWALGADMLDDALVRAVACEEKVRLRLFATPLDWLAGGGEGICILDWSAHALNQLRSPGERLTLIADNPAAATRLRQLLQWGGLPRVESMRVESAAAAAREIAA